MYAGEHSKSEPIAALVIGISAVSGGGKTALAGRLAKLLRGAVALSFDDYDDTNIHPPSIQSWFDEGADYDAFETPVFTDHIRSLKNGNHITSPVDGSRVGPVNYVVVDAPLGRAHHDSGRHIDFMVFIDTPLDVAIARRLLRTFSGENERSESDTIASIKAELESYEDSARRIYVGFVERMKRTCDLVLDGNLSLDQLATEVASALPSHP